jgi:hypothetical protein
MKSETNFWSTSPAPVRSLYFQSTSGTLGGYIVFVLGAIPALGFELLAVSADGHRTLNTHRIDD